MSARDRVVLRCCWLVASFTVPVAVLMGALSAQPPPPRPAAEIPTVDVTWIHPPPSR